MQFYLKRIISRVLLGSFFNTSILYPIGASGAVDDMVLAERKKARLRKEVEDADFYPVDHERHIAAHTTKDGILNALSLASCYKAYKRKKDDKGKGRAVDCDERADEEDGWSDSEDELDGGCMPGAYSPRPNTVFDGESGDSGTAKEEWEKFFGVSQGRCSSDSPAVFVGEERTPYGTLRHYRSGRGGNGTGSEARRSSRSKVTKKTLDDLYLKPEVEDYVLGLIRRLKQPFAWYNERNLLLHGPPGVAKSTLACIIAQEAGYEFLEVSAPDLVQVYVGSGSRALDMLLEKSIGLDKPVVIFVDELDSLTPKDKSRGSHEDVKTEASFWKKIDKCAEEYKNVFFIVALNDYDKLDERIKERFDDSRITLELPNKSERVEIIKLHVQKHGHDLTKGIYKKFARWTKGWSGRKIERLVRLAFRSTEGKEINNDALCWAYQRMCSHRAGRFDGVKTFCRQHAGAIAGVGIPALLTIGGLVLSSRAHGEQIEQAKEIAEKAAGVAKESLKLSEDMSYWQKVSMAGMGALSVLGVFATAALGTAINKVLGGN